MRNIALVLLVLAACGQRDDAPAHAQAECRRLCERARLWLGGILVARRSFLHPLTWEEEQEAIGASEAEARAIAAFRRALPLPLDPWGSRYRYGHLHDAAGSTWDRQIAVGSLGPDGRADTADDMWWPGSAAALPNDRR